MRGGLPLKVFPNTPMTTRATDASNLQDVVEPACGALNKSLMRLDLSDADFIPWRRSGELWPSERLAGSAVVLFAECAGGLADRLWGRIGSSGSTVAIGLTGKHVRAVAIGLVAKPTA